MANFSPSKSDRSWWIGIALVVIILVLVFLGKSAIDYAREPRYEGRRISLWIADIPSERPVKFDSALQAIGTNAIPYIVRELEKNDSPLRSLRPRYRVLRSKCPDWLQKVLPEANRDFVAIHGANAFYYVGTNALPYVIALLRHHSPTVRKAAAWSLFKLRGVTVDANQAIPALITVLNDPDHSVRGFALLALKEMGPDASNAVPAITTFLSSITAPGSTNADVTLAMTAASALGKIGPAATGALPVLENALHHTNPNLRGQAATAIWRISGNTTSTLPILLREMPGTSGHSKWDWIVALGEMGPRATSAIPQLKLELTQPHEQWVLHYITNALLQIDPHAFSESLIPQSD